MPDPRARPRPNQRARTGRRVTSATDRDGQGGGFTGDLSWLLDDLITRVAEISKAVVLTRDGLVIGASKGLTREDAEHLSAMAAGMQSLARSAGQHFGGGRVLQTIVEMENSFLFVTAAGEGSCLAALTTASADVGL